VRKYDPANPDKGLSTPQPPASTEAPATATPASPPRAQHPSHLWRPRRARAMPTSHYGSRCLIPNLGWERTSHCGSTRSPTRSGRGALGVSVTITAPTASWPTHRWSTAQTYQVSVQATLLRRPHRRDSLPIQVTSSPLQGLTVSASGDGRGSVSSQPSGHLLPTGMSRRLRPGRHYPADRHRLQRIHVPRLGFKGRLRGRRRQRGMQFTVPANAVSASATFDRDASQVMIPDVKGKNKEDASVQLRRSVSPSRPRTAARRRPTRS